MVDEPKRLSSEGDKASPEADTSDDKFGEYYETAEQYEAYGSSLEIQIRELKKKVRKDLQDEFASIEYLLSQREIAIKKKELELAQREADLNAREAALSRLEAFELQKSPKEIAFEESQEDITFEDFGEDERSPEEIEKEIARKKSYEGGRNKEGIGGLPGSKLSNSIVIDRGVYQGDSVSLENGNRLKWNKESKEYDFEFTPSDDPVINANRGLKFTYFAVEAAYLKDGYDNPNYPHFYSQTLLRKQVWYEKTPRNRNTDGIGEQYQGRVPLDVLMNILNSAVNTRVFTSDGKYIENQDFRRAYKNWRLKYERGTYYKTAKGDLYSILEPGSQVNESHGNPPVFRTDGNLKSPTYGQKVALSTEEKARWSGVGGSSKKKRKR